MPENLQLSLKQSGEHDNVNGLKEKHTLWYWYSEKIRNSGKSRKQRVERNRLANKAKELNS